MKETTEYFSKRIHDAIQGEEKRRVRRLEASEDFLVEFISGRFFKKRGMGYGRDISAEGILFSTFSKVKIGAKLNLAIYFSPKFPGPRKSRLNARVVHFSRPQKNGPNRVGCQLTGDPSSEDREVIRQFAWWFHLDSSRQDSKIPDAVRS